MGVLSQKAERGMMNDERKAIHRSSFLVHRCSARPGLQLHVAVLVLLAAAARARVVAADALALVADRLGLLGLPAAVCGCPVLLRPPRPLLRPPDRPQR